MELRHLRYFVAVAEEGSLTVAAQKRLHTAQPSLSRQIHDLELELGVQLLNRGPRGIELTPSGRVFLDHARVALLQVEAAGEAARRAAQPARASFAIGFLTGYEMDWLPAVSRENRFGFSTAGEAGARSEIQTVEKGSADRPDAARSRPGCAQLHSPAGPRRRDIYRRFPDPGADPMGGYQRLHQACRHRRKA